jgi:hypothetical protein
MDKSITITARLPQTLVRSLDLEMERRSEMAGGAGLLSRNSVLRLALEKGLCLLRGGMVSVPPVDADPVKEKSKQKVIRKDRLPSSITEEEERLLRKEFSKKYQRGDGEEISALLGIIVSQISGWKAGKVSWRSQRMAPRLVAMRTWLDARKGSAAEG